MNHQRFFALAAGAAVVLAASVAHADDAAPAPPPAEVTAPSAPAPHCYRQEVDGTRTETPCPPPEIEMESRWYGWQILIVDGGSIVTMPIGVGIAGYFLGGPIVHATHGHWGTSAASLGVRVAGPAIGVVAMGGPDCRGDFCGLGLLVGAAVGAVVAVGVDVALLAHEKVPVQEVETGGLDRRLFTIKPSVTPELTLPASPRRELHGVSLGLSGTF